MENSLELLLAGPAQLGGRDGVEDRRGLASRSRMGWWGQDWGWDHRAVKAWGRSLGQSCNLLPAGLCGVTAP